MDKNSLNIMYLVRSLKDFQKYLRKYHISHAGNCFNIVALFKFTKHAISGIKTGVISLTVPEFKEEEFEGSHVIKFIITFCENLMKVSLPEDRHRKQLMSEFEAIRLQVWKMINSKPRTINLPDFSKIEDAMFDL